MNKQINYELSKEKDGVKAHIDVIDETISATVTFSPMQYYPFVLGEESLKAIKTEINILLSKINEIKKDERKKPTTRKRTSSKK